MSYVPDDPEDTLDPETWALFSPKGASAPTCCVCLLSPAVCLHEIEPRSMRPNDWWAPDNRIALCHKCHRAAHTMGTRRASEYLLVCRSTYLKSIGRA